MTPNMGTTDRAIRALVALGAVVLAFVLDPTTWPAIAFWVVAAIMALTAATGFCPLYLVTGTSTRRTDTVAR